MRLKAGDAITFENTGMNLTPYLLSHSEPYESSSFLLENKENYVLYLGDTGADSLEHSEKMYKLWQAITPIIKRNRLKAIFIEVSFSEEQPDKQLIGQLTPKWFMQEMDVLAKLHAY